MLFSERLTSTIKFPRVGLFSLLATLTIPVITASGAGADGLPTKNVPVEKTQLDPVVGTDNLQDGDLSDLLQTDIMETNVDNLQDSDLSGLLQTDIMETNAAMMPLSVAAGTARALKLQKDADSVAIGDPEIADIVVHTPRLLFVSGKAFGTTNLLIFDKSGRTLYSNDVVVTVNTSNLLTVTRAGQEQAYNCTPKCQVRASYENEGTN